MARWITVAVVAAIIGLLAYGELRTPPVGDPAVYARINSHTDCVVLAAEFDTAYATHQPRKITLGYMTAAVDRMEALGC